MGVTKFNLIINAIAENIRKCYTHSAYYEFKILVYSTEESLKRSNWHTEVSKGLYGGFKALLLITSEQITDCAAI